MDVLLCRSVPILPPPLLIIGARFGATLYVATTEEEVKALLKPSNMELVIMDAMLGATALAAMVKMSASTRSIASIHISAKRGGEAGFCDFVERTLSIYSLLRPMPMNQLVVPAEEEAEEEES